MHHINVIKILLDIPQTQINALAKFRHPDTLSDLRQVQRFTNNFNGNAY